MDLVKSGDRVEGVEFWGEEGVGDGRPTDNLQDRLDNLTLFKLRRMKKGGKKVGFDVIEYISKSSLFYHSGLEVIVGIRILDIPFIILNDFQFLVRVKIVELDERR